MASIQRVQLFSQVGLTATTTNADRVGLPARARCPIGYLTVSAANAATTVAATIQHSPDGVSGWTTFVTFTTTAAGASANEVILPTVGVGVLIDRILPHVRAVIVLGGATKVATVTVDLYVENFAG